VTRIRLARVLLAAHGVAVAFALLGLLVAIPHPELWSGIPGASSIFRFGMEYAGALHIVLGAGALAAFGGAVLGWGRTAIFFVASTCLSLSMELLGTGTGWPFGAYEYTAGLGYKVLGRVPFSIPLSWFYMGLTSYLLALLILARLAPGAPTWAAVGIGVWLLTAWDLVLDPAMSHPDLPIRFWTWHQAGPYMGMPLINFAGWSLTGALFMIVSRLAWRGLPHLEDVPRTFPFTVYAINMSFGIALSANVGLHLPIGLALVLGMAPACLVWRRRGAPERAATAIS
jgi:putative membrane protein